MEHFGLWRFNFPILVLARKDVQINAQDITGKTAVVCAALKGNIDIIRLQTVKLLNSVEVNAKSDSLAPEQRLAS